ncbi:MAG: Ig-like domain-containing protein [Acholeplasmatales bacterium]|nr:Ig-like domain-containing protein [Acholeplasmatales bacterium]
MKKLLTKFALVLVACFAFLGFAGKANAATELNPTVKQETITKATKVSDGDYVLVTSASQLVAGRKVIIAAADYSYAMYYVHSDNSYQYTYRQATSLTKTTSDGTKIAVPSSSVAKFVLKAGYKSGTYSFYDENYDAYLGASSNSSNYLALYTGVSAGSSFTVSVTSSGVATVKAQSYTNNTIKYNSSYKRFTCYKSGQKNIAIYQEYASDSTTPTTPTTVSVTGVSLSVTNGTIEVGKSGSLTATVTPSNATNKNVTWSSSNTNVATVSSTGVVTGVAAGTAKITVKTVDGGYTATCNLTVTTPTQTEPETPTTSNAAWTIMIYICGADLESQNYLATSDLKEILSVAGQPSDVNIIIQTGGAKKWSSTYGISASYTQRYYVRNKQLVKEANLTKANMGLQSTFQSFVEWGLNNYPADKTGIIMWNHGGAMQGVCYDENYSSDSLLNSEVKGALTSAFANTGRTKKLEFIGYDACLMSVQDVAEFNSNFFNYMIASEESESGYGWDYDTWVDDLYSKKSTTTILKAIVDGFIADNGGVNSSYNDQTLSYLNLAYMQAYKTAWENMAKQLANKITSSNKSSFNTLVKSVKHYGDTYYTYYGTFDAKDFVNKLSSNSKFNPGSTYTNAVLTAFNNLVAYSSCGRGAGNSYGLCMFWSISSNCYKGTYYTSAQTNFSNWRSLVSSYGA